MEPSTYPTNDKDITDGLSETEMQELEAAMKEPIGKIQFLKRSLR